MNGVPSVVAECGHRALSALTKNGCASTDIRRKGA